MSSVAAEEAVIQVVGGDGSAAMDFGNRDDALRARDTAERKFGSRDMKGARKFAMKAQKLFPSLEGISQMVSTMDVYYAAESKIDNESDWYGVLSLPAFADEEAVKKQYRKLALQLHPDKNKSVGAEGAFKLISEAWSVLSDKSRKMVYDQKRKDAAAAAVVNGVHMNEERAVKKRNRKRSNSEAAQPPPPPAAVHTSGLDTFWTSCNRCRMQYEYLRVYLNHNLLCPNCHNAFMAVETGYPCNGTNTAFTWPPAAKSNSQQAANHTSAKGLYASSSKTTSTFSGAAEHSGYQHELSYDSYGGQTFQWGQYSKPAAVGTTNSYTIQACEKSKQNQDASYVFEYSAAATTTPTADVYGQDLYTTRRGRPPKRRKEGDFSNSEFSIESKDSRIGMTEKATTNEGEQINNGAVRENSRSWSRRRKNIRDFSQIDTRGLLIEKAKSAVADKMNELTVSISMKLKAKSKQKEKENPKDKSEKVENTASDYPTKQQKSYASKGNGNQAVDEQSSLLDPTGEPMPITRPVSSIDVPDPDFHDFDKDRTEKAFDADQIWATYDSEDGMPRLYAMIQKIITLRPFKVRMSFLNSKSNVELGPLNWVSCGFSKTCGDFRVGRYQITETINMFSHKVCFKKGPRGIISILPKKGDTWALYRNWSADWNELTPDDVIYKYEIVEVSEDYTEEKGVDVVPLLKVPDFKAIFRRHVDPKEVRRIPREEMFRFSHQIPSRLLTGEEGPSAPKGCHELDPAATPVDFLQVITEAKDDMRM